MFALLSFSLNAQKVKKIPDVNIKNLKNETINTSSFNNNNNPMIISFWATWCKPCVRELSNISDLYDEWRKETGVKVIAISTDNSRSSIRVAPFVSGKGWEFDIYLDTNQDFKQAMNVPNIPHTFLIDGNGNIVYEHANYTEGDEEELYEHLLEVIDEK